MRPHALACAAALLLAGCAAAPPDVETAPAAVDAAAPAPETVQAEKPAASRRSVALDGCAYCYEPTVAADPEGRLFVTTGSASEGIGVSSDGGATWTTVDVPPVPDGASPTAHRGDPTVQVDPEGRLVYHALLLDVGWSGPAAAFVFEGFQVAASEDAGRSWAWNTLVAATTTGDPTAEGDRQWIAFGPEGEAYLSQNQYVAFGRAPLPLAVFPAAGTGLRVARSDDGGRAFGAFAEVVARPPAGGTIGGQPVVDAAGRLLVPYFVYGRSEAGLFVAVSEDRGATFAHHEVYAPDDLYPGAMFPSLALGGDGRLHLAWWKAGDVLLATSGDGGRTWSRPVKVGTGAAVNSPWLAPSATGLDLLWSESADGDASVTWLVRGADRFDLGRAAGTPGRGAYTDFLHAARLPDGTLAAVLVAEAGERGRIEVALAPSP